MDLELLRTIILAIGWPLLVAAGTLFFISAYSFYIRTHKLALGKLIVAGSIGQSISMISLGIVATSFLFVDLERSIFIVLTVFAIWFAVIVATYVISRKWSSEAEKINVLYYKLKERSDQLEKEQGKLSHVAENMQTGAILLDGIGNLLFINREARNVLGFDTEGEDKEILGALYQKFSAYGLKKKVSECVDGHPSNILGAESDGKTYEIFLRNLIDKDQLSVAFGHFIWIHDVTSAKALERAKYNFIKVASHKLRTPLAGLKMNTELLMDECYEQLDESKRSYLNNIVEANQYISEVTEQLLSVATSDSQEFKVIKEPLSLIDTIKSVIETFDEGAAKEDYSISFITPEEGLFKINSDKKLLSEALSVIIDNATKYLRKDGERTVKVSLLDKGSSYEVQVVDSGIGIENGAQEQVFQKFFRTEESLKMYPNGSGVNLSLAKNLVKAVGGDITFTSTEGVGSTFKLLLPKNI